MRSGTTAGDPKTFVAVAFSPISTDRAKANGGDESGAAARTIQHG